MVFWLRAIYLFHLCYHCGPPPSYVALQAAVLGASTCFNRVKFDAMGLTFSFDVLLCCRAVQPRGLNTLHVLVLFRYSPWYASTPVAKHGYAVEGRCLTHVHTTQVISLFCPALCGQPECCCRHASVLRAGFFIVQHMWMCRT